MYLIKMAWKNIWRNKTRTIITISGIYFAVILSTAAEGLKQGIFENLVNNIVGMYTGYIQIHKKGYQTEQILDNSMNEENHKIEKIKSIKNIRFISERVETYALVASEWKTKGCMIVGINPDEETKITNINSKIINGEYLKENDKSVLITNGLSKKLNVTLNDTIIVIGQGYHGTLAGGKYPVKGIIRLGSPQLNEKLLYMPKKVAQSLFECEKRITSYVVAINNKQSVKETANEIRKLTDNQKEVLTWEDIIPEVKQHITTDSNNMKIVQVILYLLISFGMLSTMIMLIMERKYEMGLLVAIGMKKSKLIAVFMYETIITSLIGCIAGVTSSLPLLYYFKGNPIKMSGETARAYEKFGFEAIFPTSTQASIFINQGCIVLLIGIIMGLYPAIKIFRLNPLSAMKK